MGHQPIVMHAGVALVDRHRVLAVARLDIRQALGHQRKGVVPGNGLPFVANTLHGLAQAIRIVLDILQSHRLGADVTAAEGVQRIALDRGDRQALAVGFGDLQGQAADGFT
ncbi:hypothetical protein D3C78_1532420 [compost metagenome]